jgi:hypothetical protein
MLLATLKGSEMLTPHGNIRDRLAQTIARSNLGGATNSHCVCAQ